MRQPSLISTLSTLTLYFNLVLAVPHTPQWTFNLKESSSGIVALESVIVSPTLALFFNRPSHDPLQINGHSAMGAIWNLRTSTVQPLNVASNSFCGTGALISNGSLVAVGGDTGDDDYLSGHQGIRIFEPCGSPSGQGCTLFENLETHSLYQPRWYPSSIRIFDGSLMIVGGSHALSEFYNIDPESSFEFFPPKEAAPRPSAFLERSLPSNLYPRIFALPDGRVFMVANNQSIIYDIETGTETILPDIPNNVRVTNPFDGSAILLPLSPPSYIPEVLVCGGTQTDLVNPSFLSSQTPASSQCSRIKLTPSGIAQGWQVEHMLEGRAMPELLHLPNGEVLIANGGKTGFAAYSSVPDPIGRSNADHPAFKPSIYTPSRPLGQRISNSGMPSTNIPRLYHSSITLTPQGNFLIAGSNPNGDTTYGVTYGSEFRVETLDPPYMFTERPKLLRMPTKLRFGQRFVVPVSIPRSIRVRDVKVSLMDLGFSTHAFHSGARLVFMKASLSPGILGRHLLTFTAPPNGRVYPPGPATVFLTVDGVSSEGAWVMMGSGAPPPTLE